MPLNSSWRPAEDERTILIERTMLVGMILTAVTYGMVFTLFILTFRQLMKTTTKCNYTKRLPFIIYITVMLIVGTLYLGSIAKMTELSFIDYRLFPGGPGAFEKIEFSIPVNQLSTVSFAIANWLADGMVIYRYLVIFRSTCQFPLWVIMLMPGLGYMASISIGVVWLIQVSAFSPWTNTQGAINFTTPYCVVSVCLNVSLTLAICIRLLFYRRKVASVLGPKHGTQYTTVAAIIVESAVLYSGFALLFLIPFLLDSPIQNVFMQPMGELQIIATFLIIYRVACGIAWASGTSSAMLIGKEAQNSGVRVQVEISSPQKNLSDSDIRQHGELEYGMKKFAVTV